MRRRPFPLITLLIVFAIVGFSYRLWNDPMQLLKQVFLIGLVAAVFYGIYKWIQRQSFSRSYQKAVKQSKKLHHQKTKPTSKKQPRPTALKKKHATHLTVIEGKKGKKKNRASF
ncbi:MULTISPECIES: SA1362 family protein [Anoxybacillus]|uniref:Uncharacterized protein n=1 Tax=Anoxybacillus ayderensis TaxID=265546 RepID=A0A0D0HSJ0_9BACL|nr:MULTISPECIES: SA1362 family protein [Anoxybacillus]EPZ38133.1 membrane protein [Anoxybacillus ayderensis]KIP22217.1 hypothetical protein JV16_00765 [Anoxybacillus ayderensis]MED0685778.1 SA1362 family protein [Anoxybacillus ayderensis]NNU96096.1 hypothetical protein [Anoxybacillus sp. EFIL]OSX54030.1 hypothetical protein B7H16_08440 [Anoxybacillus ayderensis]